MTNFSKLFAAIFITLFMNPLFGQTLIINEFMASNNITIADENGEFEDWVEIYNPGNTAIDMAGMYFTDDLATPNLWQIPSGSMETIIQAGGFKIFWFDKDVNQGALHVNAKLSGSGEQIGLYFNNLELIDGLTYTDQSTDVSYGRTTDGGNDWAFFSIPTPGLTNVQTIQAATVPVFSHTTGSYADPISVTLSNSSPGSNIYYTLDGHVPTEASTLYQGAILVDTSMTVRAISAGNGYDASDFSTQIYLINVSRAFPIVYIAFDPFDFYDPATGMYVNYTQDIEKPADVAFFETDGSLAFHQPAKVEIQGSNSAVFPHKSLGLKAKKYNGEKKFQYPLFPTQSYDKYGSFILRNSGQDWNSTVFRDAFASSLVRDLSDVGSIIARPNLILQDYRPTITYFNGEYRGIYNMRERYDKRYLKTHFGLSSSEYDYIKKIDEVKSGTIDAWNEFMQFMYENDMSDQANFDSLTKIMDVDAYMDYAIFNVFIDNTDWPDNNNRRYKEHNNGKWRWLVYDLDFSYGLEGENGAWDTGEFDGNALERLYNAQGWESPNPEYATRPFRACASNSAWRIQFINRMADHLNTLFTADRQQERLDQFQALYEPEIAEHYERWTFWAPKWYQNVGHLTNFISGRTPVVRDHFVQHYSEINGTSNMTLSANPVEGGQIEFSTLTLSQEHFPWSGIYFAGVDIPVKAIPAPGYEFVGWSQPSLGTNPDVSINLAVGSYSLTANFQPIGSNGVLTFSCPDDINITTSSTTAIGTWIAPLATTTCSTSNSTTVSQIGGLAPGSVFTLGTHTISYQATDECNNSQSCSFNLNVTTEVTTQNCDPIDGFTMLGQYNGHGYYMSNTIATWDEANILAENVGGYLTSITTQEENDFIMGGLNGTMALIGFSDYNSEGNGQWANGEPTTLNLSYDNNTNNDYGVINFWDGKWQFVNVLVKKQFIVEMDCNSTNNGVLTLSCPNDININTTTGIVTWSNPVATTSCPTSSITTIEQTLGLPSGSSFPVGSQTIIYQASDECNNIQTCSFVVDVISGIGNDCGPLDGFATLGQYNGHTYYMSNLRKTWIQANEIAQDNSGYLTTINSQEENDNIQSWLGNDFAFIGYNDAYQEGVGAWAWGNSPLNFSYANNATNDYAMINFWAGNWQMVNEYVEGRFIMEKNCANGQPNPIVPLSQPQMSVFPNPATSLITVSILTEIDDYVAFTIYNSLGQAQFSQEGSIIRGMNKIDFDISKLKSGVYFIKANGQHIDQIFRFITQN